MFGRNLLSWVVWDPEEKALLRYPSETKGAWNLDNTAQGRWEEFWLWSRRQEQWGKFLHEETTQAGIQEKLLASRYIQHLPLWMKSLAQDREDKIKAGVRHIGLSTLVQMFNAITRWGRECLKFCGVNHEPVDLKWLPTFMAKAWELARNNAYAHTVVEFPWPAAVATAASPSLIREAVPRPRRLEGQDHADSGLIWPSSHDLLPLSAVDKEAPWWLRIMFMEVPTGVRDIKLLYAPRLDELRKLSVKDNGVGNHISFAKRCLVLRQFKNGTHRAERQIPLTNPWLTELAQRTSSSTLTPVPAKPAHMIVKYLRPACIAHYGADVGKRIVLSNNTLRVLAFHRLMRDISGMDLEAYEWLMLRDAVVKIHDHTFETALASYSKQIPEDAKLAFADRLKQVFDHPDYDERVKDTYKRLNAAITMGTVSQEATPEVPYQGAVAAKQLASRRLNLECCDEETALDIALGNSSSAAAAAGAASPYHFDEEMAEEGGPADLFCNDDEDSDEGGSPRKRAAEQENSHLPHSRVKRTKELERRAIATEAAMQAAAALQDAALQIARKQGIIPRITFG